jgi:hypothetical protein
MHSTACLYWIIGNSITVRSPVRSPSAARQISARLAAARAVLRGDRDRRPRRARQHRRAQSARVDRAQAVAVAPRRPRTAQAPARRSSGRAALVARLFHLPFEATHLTMRWTRGEMDCRASLAMTGMEWWAPAAGGGCDSWNGATPPDAARNYCPFGRHCERSAAIHLTARRTCGYRRRAASMSLLVSFAVFEFRL